jgi:hypothetical protein
MGEIKKMKKVRDKQCVWLNTSYCVIDKILRRCGGEYKKGKENKNERDLA